MHLPRRHGGAAVRNECRARRRGLAGSASVALVALGLAFVRELSAQEPEPPPAPSPSADAPVQEPGAQRVMDLNDRGSRLYAAGDYRRAVELFLQAYAVSQDPNLLFNIASCYEGLGDRDAALEKYRAFLDAPDAEPEGRPRAEGAIERLMQSPSPIVAVPMPAAEPPLAEATSASPPEDQSSSKAGSGWVPWVGLGAGAAFGALGTTLYLLGAADHAEVTDAQGYDDPNAVISITHSRADDLIESGDTKKALGVASVSVGAALITGSVIWWLLDEPGESNAPGAAFVSVDPSGVNVAVSGRF
jgi:tetratricopeptide (TPR) repeat protein